MEAVLGMTNPSNYEQYVRFVSQSFIFSHTAAVIGWLVGLLVGKFIHSFNNLAAAAVVGK